MEDQNTENTEIVGSTDANAETKPTKPVKAPRVPGPEAQAAIDAILAIPLDAEKWDVAQVTKIAFQHRDACRDYRAANVTEATTDSTGE